MNESVSDVAYYKERLEGANLRITYLKEALDQRDLKIGTLRFDIHEQFKRERARIGWKAKLKSLAKTLFIGMIVIAWYENFVTLGWI